jgi:hypothetical protein
MAESSPLDRVRRRYDELRGAVPQTLHIPVGRGIDGDLVIEYAEQDWVTTQEIKDRWVDDESPKAVLYAQAEQLAHCCVDIHVRDDENGRVLPNLPGRYLPGLGTGQGTVSFHAAAELLGKPVDDPKQAVWAVLLNDWEIERHYRRLGLWEPGLPAPETEEVLLGESVAATAA